jgi:hypothetical protein
MSTVSMLTIAPRVRRVVVTIPGSGAAAVSLESLVASVLDVGDLPSIMGGRINPVAAAYTAGDAVGDQPLTIAIGKIYEEPAGNFLHGTFVKAVGVGSISAVVSVYLTAR